MAKLPAASAVDGEPPGDLEPSLEAIMEAIRDVKSSLEPELDTVMLDVNFKRAEFHEMSEKVKSVESHIHLLQSTIKKLEDQVESLKKQHAQMAARLEDQEGRARRNNIWVVGVPVGAKGAAVDLFLEDLITNHLPLKRLSKFFSIEWTHRTPVPRQGLL
ncbi:hypothetical protein NDU88_002075 [Pleurodeles waltl]|uniref:Uncharacterized protein n=1 Tax=Pleurodeles waltl TaxID=8319 RepID=A0AAV7TJM2_PLEWA|nr:hypothetical protein NDU88_002075 [Pleurodeles waltl]